MYTYDVTAEVLTSSNVCSMQPDAGKCADVNETRWFYDATSGRCLPFTFGGCDGSANNFRSEAECGTVCMNQGWSQTPNFHKKQIYMYMYT